MLAEKYIGLALAIVSTMAIGTSFVITKKGLLDASDKHGFEGEGFVYLKSPIWWAGIITMILGEVANFAAYAFAPAILVTPLGALSVLIGAVLGAYFLKEDLGTLGKLGCAMCLIGSVIIVLHAPPDKEITRVDEILQYAIHPGTASDKYIVYLNANIVFLARIFNILHRCSSLFDGHDLPNSPKIWKEESPHLYINLFNRGLCLRHVGESFRHCLEVDVRRRESIHLSFDLCIHDCHHCLHIDTNELL